MDFAALGSIGEYGRDEDIEWDSLGRVLLVLSGLTIGGAGFYFLGSALSDPRPKEVVEIYNREVGE